MNPREILAQSLPQFIARAWVHQHPSRYAALAEEFEIIEWKTCLSAKSHRRMLGNDQYSKFLGFGHSYIDPNRSSCLNGTRAAARHFERSSCNDFLMRYSCP